MKTNRYQNVRRNLSVAALSITLLAGCPGDVGPGYLEESLTKTITISGRVVDLDQCFFTDFCPGVEGMRVRLLRDSSRFSAVTKANGDFCITGVPARSTHHLMAMDASNGYYVTTVQGEAVEVGDKNRAVGRVFAINRYKKGLYQLLREAGWASGGNALYIGLVAKALSTGGIRPLNQAVARCGEDPNTPVKYLACNPLSSSCTAKNAFNLTKAMTGILGVFVMTPKTGELTTITVNSPGDTFNTVQAPLSLKYITVGRHRKSN